MAAVSGEKLALNAIGILNTLSLLTASLTLRRYLAGFNPKKLSLQRVGPPQCWIGEAYQPACKMGRCADPP